MKQKETKLQFFLDLARVQAILTRKFDGRLGAIHGIGMTDFMLLSHLAKAPDEKMRRIDLAEKIGLTASGVTRLLIPMEKIGLVRRETDKQDARVSYVMLAPGGKRLFTDALEQAEVLAEDIIAASHVSKPEVLMDSVAEFAARLS